MRQTEAIEGGAVHPDDTVAEGVTWLLDRYEYSLYNYLLVQTRNPEIARDCVQHTFVAALEHLQRGRTVQAAWLYKVARNKGIDELRHHQRQDAAADLEVLAAADSSPRAAEVRRAMAQLAPEERELLYLYDVDGFTAEQIGSMIGARVSAVRMRVLRARRRFREVYEREGENHEAAR
jgi:RNA polymerase sigma-70 factor, ECF subfamily